MKFSQVSTYAPLTLASTLLWATAGQAATITAIANSDPAVPDACDITQLIDGDFTIQANATNPPVTCLGDGTDETITWDFDFTNDPDLVDFLASAVLKGKLQSAIAMFTITPTNGLISTDQTFIPGVPEAVFNLSTLTGVPGVGETGTFSIDLLAEGVPGSTIINVLASDEAGKIPWKWQDDVVMHSAKLELRIPEPATALGLLCFGVLAPIVQRSKTQKR